MRVFLDTNFVVDLFRFKIDPAEIYDLLPTSRLSTLDLVVKELKKLANSTSRDARYARLALKFVNVVEILPAKKTKVDDSLLQVNTEDVVATNDIKLRKKLMESGIKTIYLRARKHLELS